MLQERLSLISTVRELNSPKMFVTIILITFIGLANCNLDNNCTEVATSQGTRSFIELIFKKYGTSKSSLTLSKRELDTLMKGVAIGRLISKRIRSSYRMDEFEQELTLNIAKGLLNRTIDKSRCYDSDTILMMHGINASNGISRNDFTRICPSFIQQIESKNCVQYTMGSREDDTPTKSQTWGYGFISITVISFLSLAVIAIIPFIKKSIYARVMSYLVALAVGTLSGDALLHLIPHAFGQGTNNAIGLSVTEKEELKQEYSQVWRALFVLLGIYAFFAVELLMKLRGGHGHSHGNDKSVHEHDERNDAPKVGTPTKERTRSTKSVSYDNQAINIEFSDTSNGAPTYQTGNDVVIYKSQRKQSLRDPGEKKITKETHVATVAWVVIIGDGFHNFSDGLAIGAAFSASISSGLSTSIAVFCHELPHELGDFAILLNSGMTIKQAVVYNIVSTILAYAGLTVGILAGGDEIGRHFILSITAGLFLYVSLADLLPELTNEDIPNQSKWCTFLTQHFGIITGIAIMLVISLYEHAI